MVLPAFLHQKRLQWAVHVVRMDDSCIPQTVTIRCCRGRRPMRKPRGRKGSAVWRDDKDLLQTLNWKVAARYGEGCRKVIWGGHSAKTGQSTTEEEEPFHHF